MFYILVLVCALVMTAPALAGQWPCDGVEVTHSRAFPGTAAAQPGHMVFNPRRMRALPAPVQKFIFYHECAHAQGKANSRNSHRDEFRADRLAFERATREGWMTPRILQQICNDLGDEKASRTHPSGPARCKALKR